MKALSLAAVVLVSLGCVAAQEKKQTKQADIGGFPFWTSQKQPHAPPFVPGLNSVLEISDAQREQIATAQMEFGNDEGVKAARSISKSDPNVTAEQRDKARAAIDAATARLHDKVKTILTPEQQALVGKINAAHAAAVEEVAIVYADKFATIKADQEARRRIMEEKNQDQIEGFLQKLDGVLNASQKAALEAAAAAEEQRMKNAPIKKPRK